MKLFFEYKFSKTKINATLCKSFCYFFFLASVMFQCSSKLGFLEVIRLPLVFDIETFPYPKYSAFFLFGCARLFFSPN